jgi:hypothetical protein
VSTDNAGSSDARWRPARDEAIAALEEALDCDLPAARWEQVADAVAQMAAAVAAGSVDDLWRATGRLKLCGPWRVGTRAGDTPELPAPMATRERIAELADALTADGKRSAGGKPDQDRQARS